VPFGVRSRHNYLQQLEIHTQVPDPTNTPSPALSELIHQTAIPIPPSDRNKAKQVISIGGVVGWVDLLGGANIPCGAAENKLDWPFSG